MRCASRREQPVSLRRHYPHQVLGRSSSSSLSAFRLPFGCASSSRTRPTTRSALFCARMGGGFCSDGCGDGRETVMTTARNMGELAGFAIPRLGMGTMALAIEGRPDRDTAIRTIHAAWTRACDIWTPPGRITCQANPAPAPPKTWLRRKNGARRARQLGRPRDEVLIATKTGYRRTMERRTLPKTSRNASICRLWAASTGGWRIRVRKR